MKDKTRNILGIAGVVVIIIVIMVWSSEHKVDTLNFYSDEETVISLFASDDTKNVYQYYQTDHEGGIRKGDNKNTRVNIGKPYWLSTMLEQLRKEKPITAYYFIPGLIVQDSYTKQVYFIKWNSELANTFCATIKDDRFQNACERYKSYNYPNIVNFYARYSDQESMVEEKYRLNIGDTTYIIKKDNGIVRRNNNQDTTLSDSFSSYFEKILTSIKKESKQVDSQKERTLYDVKENKYYEILKSNPSSRKLVNHLIRINEGYHAQQLMHKYVILGYKGEDTPDEWYRMYEETSDMGYVYSDYKRILEFYSNQDESEAELVEMDQNHFILKENNDYYEFDKNLYEEKELYTQEENLTKLNHIWISFESNTPSITYHHLESVPENQQIECKTTRCTWTSNYDYDYLIKDDDYYIYNAENHELTKLNIDISEDYKLIEELDSANVYVLKSSTGVEFVDKKTLEIRKKIEGTYFSYITEAKAKDNLYYLTLNYQSGGQSYFDVYNQNFEKIFGTLEEKDSPGVRFTDYQVLENGNLLLLNMTNGETYKNTAGETVNRIISHVEINPKGELINPQEYENKTEVVGNIVFEITKEKLIAYDMYHKELASIGYENLGYGTNEKCIGEDYSGTDGNAYFILLGKSNEYAKKYIYHKNSNSFTVEDSTCYIQGR